MGVEMDPPRGKGATGGATGFTIGADRPYSFPGHRPKTTHTAIWLQRAAHLTTERNNGF